MSPTTKDETAKPLDARVVRTREAVLAAAADVLVEVGAAGFSIEAVVTRSGVARTTIYRHWPTRDALVRDAFARQLPTPQTIEDHDTFEDALRRVVDATLETIREPHWRRLFIALIEEAHHTEDLAALEEAVMHGGRDVLRHALQLGIDQGVLPPDIDLDEAALQLMGPLLLAGIDIRTTPTPALGERMIELFLASRR